MDSLIASVTAEKSALENVKSDKELMTVAHRINGVSVVGENSGNQSGILIKYR